MPESPSSSTPGATSSGSSAEPGDTDLTIVINDGSGSTKTWRLTCNPAGGTHPDPQAACRGPRDQRRCGTAAGAEGQGLHADLWRPGDSHHHRHLEGPAGDEQFARNDGCQISRWKLMEGLLPRGGN